MLKIIILLAVSSLSLLSQSLRVFDLDISNFPILKAKFFAFDSSGNQIFNLTPSDFQVTENGLDKKVISVSCPKPKPIRTVSVAMSIDVSGSMAYSEIGVIPVELGKITAIELCNQITMPPSEFALQVCDSKAFILQDFTTNKNVILSKIAPITANGDNNFVEHILNPLTGLINIAKNGKYERNAVIYTDAWWYRLTELELQRCIDTCKKYGIRFFAVIYSRPEAQPDGIKKSLQTLADATGGILFDGITSKDAAIKIGALLQSHVQSTEPCSIEWESAISCNNKITDCDIKCSSIGAGYSFFFQPPASSVAYFEIEPNSIKFLKTLTDTCTTIRIKAFNSDFYIERFIESNPSYRIEPSSGFILKAGESRDFTVCYTPADSGYTFCKFIVENDLCPAVFYASGGFPGKKPNKRTLKLIHPNGGDVFVAGSDTVITWEGVLTDESVSIEYSTNNGLDWMAIEKDAKGLSYKWKIPNTPSNLCLARVTARYGNTQFEYPEVKICNQIWMSENLNTEYYRNGDTIPEITDYYEWSQSKTGAWCYFNFDPANGEVYKKLYNWYAVNDPRGLAPEGWHIPIEAEWIELTDCLGGKYVAGGKLKSTGTVANGDGLWLYSNIGATNESGFNGHPGGYLFNSNEFVNLGIEGSWWTSTETSMLGVTVMFLHTGDANIFWNTSGSKIWGCSVRCVKD